MTLIIFAHARFKISVMYKNYYMTYNLQFS